MTRQHGVAGISGLLFALGLGLAGMTDPNKVLNFLDLFGAWDPSLALVMGGAILVYAPVSRWLRAKAAPKFGDRFHWPTKQDIDRKLVGGALLFGVGWGLAGYCPGPAIVAAAGASAGLAVGATTTSPALAFFAAMALGMFAQGFIARRRDTLRAGQSQAGGEAVKRGPQGPPISP